MFLVDFLSFPHNQCNVDADSESYDLHFQILLPVVEKEKLNGLIIPEVEVGQARDPSRRFWVLKKRSQYEPMSPICTSKKGACMFTTTVSLFPCSKESFTSPVFSAMRPSHLLEMVKFNFFFLGLSWRCFTTL